MFAFEPVAPPLGVETASTAANQAQQRAAFEAAFAGVGRRFGYAPTTLTSEELLRLAEGWAAALLGTSSHAAWGAAELAVLLQEQPLATLARIALLSAWVEAAEDATRVAVLNRVFHTGDAQEREAVLRALPLLPKPERFLELSVEACRTHVQRVFEALACENPYPARYFPEAAFNQMVVKCLFTEVQLVRVLGLPERRNAELFRMASDYESERRAAGRTVPQDIELAKA
jgi:hypothetical protein